MCAPWQLCSFQTLRESQDSSFVLPLRFNKISVQYQSVPHKDGNGRPQGEEPCDVTTVPLFRQDARRGKAPFEHWK